MSHLKTEIWNVSGTGKHFLILCNDRAQDHLLIHKHWIANAYTFCNSHSCMTSSKRYRLNSKLWERGREYLKFFLYLYFYSKNLIYIGISIFLSLYVRNSTMKCLCRFDPYVLYLEYSTFSDKLFSRAQYQLSLTDQMDCKSQKGRIGIGNITRNRNDEHHNCLLNNQKYVIDTRLFKCIN